jgi:hypothetical protein
MCYELGWGIYTSRIPKLTFVKFVHYETINQEPNERLLYEGRCDERLKAKAEKRNEVSSTEEEEVGEWFGPTLLFSRKHSSSPALPGSRKTFASSLRLVNYPLQGPHFQDHCHVLLGVPHHSTMAQQSVNSSTDLSDPPFQSLPR